LGTLPKSATVGWSATQIMDLDFPEPGIRARQQPLLNGCWRRIGQTIGARGALAAKSTGLSVSNLIEAMAINRL